MCRELLELAGTCPELVWEPPRIGPRNSKNWPGSCPELNGLALELVWERSKQPELVREFLAFREIIYKA